MGGEQRHTLTKKISFTIGLAHACCCMPRQACVRCAVVPVRGAETSPPLCVGACHTQVTLSVRTYYCRSDRGLLAPIHGAPSCMRVRVRARPVREWHMVCDRCSKTTQHGRTTEGGSFGAGKRRVSVLTQGVDQVHVPLPSVLPRGTRRAAAGCPRGSSSRARVAVAAPVGARTNLTRASSAREGYGSAAAPNPPW